jgi:large subunit ribosomal protein L15
MQTNLLKRIHPNTKRMIVARGGKRGKTAGRGGKGQSARAGNKRRPEWRDIIKKLPKLRGRGVNQNKPFQEKPVVVNLSLIEGVFSAKDSVTPAILLEKGIVSTWSGNTPLVKILGDGELTKALNFSGCFVSESAKAKIEKAGGSITPVPSRVVVKVMPIKAPKPVKTPEEKAAAAALREKNAKPAKGAKPAKTAKPAKEKSEKAAKAPVDGGKIQSKA